MIADRPRRSAVANPVQALRRVLPLVLGALGLVACRAGRPAGEAPPADPERRSIEAVLDDWHAAASEADGERYFGHMSADAVFLGTDAGERWTREEFRAYARPHFDAGRGWTYTVLERHVYVGPAARTAWFDERLHNEKYGECRGSGTLRKAAGAWKVAHYNLTFPVPNELAAEVVERIREHLEASRAR